MRTFSARPFDPVELLAFHAEALGQGKDLTELMAQTYGSYWPELPGLLRLAQKLSAQLSPAMMPRRKAHLNLSNLETHTSEYAVPNSTGWWVRALRGVLLAGSALSMVGLSLYWLGFLRLRSSVFPNVETPA